MLAQPLFGARESRLLRWEPMSGDEQRRGDREGAGQTGEKQRQCVKGYYCDERSIFFLATIMAESRACTTSVWRAREPFAEMGTHPTVVKAATKSTTNRLHARQIHQQTGDYELRLEEEATLFQINWDMRCLEPGNVAEILAMNHIRNVRLGRYLLQPRSKPENSSSDPEVRRQRVDGVVCPKRTLPQCQPLQKMERVGHLTSTTVCLGLGRGLHQNHSRDQASHTP